MSNNDFVIENGVLTKYTGAGGDVVIPDGVTEIGQTAFFGCKGLTSITIPGSVKKIGPEAFLYCSELISVDILEGVEVIGHEAFKYCLKLKNISIPDSVTEIEWGAIEDTECYKSHANQEEDFYIGNHLIKANSSVKGEITLPSGTKSIVRSAFKECKELTKVIIPEGVISIEYKAFAFCRGLKEVIISDGLESIGNNAFEHCESLEKVIMPGSVTSIGDEAFYKCDNLLLICEEDLNLKLKESQFVHFKGSEIKCRLYLPKVGISSIPTPLKRSAVRGMFDMIENGAPKEMQDDYAKYLKRERKNYYPLFNRDNRILKFFIERKLIPIEDVEPVLQTLADNASKAALIDYSNSFSAKEKKDKEKKEQADFEKSVGLRKLSIADYKKIYTLREVGSDYYEIAKYKGNDEVVEIPEIIGKRKVRKICCEAFAKNTTVKRIVIPNSVSLIGPRAFWKCSTLEEIIMPDGPVTTVIDARNVSILHGTLFYKNKKNWTDGVLYAGKHLISVNEKKIADKVIIKEGTIDVLLDAFLKCSELAEITIPDSVVDFSGTLPNRLTIVIKCKEGSCAHNYAQNYKINFELI